MTEFFSFDELPPEIKERILDQANKKMMENSGYTHSVQQFFDSLDEDSMIVMRDIISECGGSAAAASMFTGIISGVLHQKFKRCFACGKNHDEEIASMAESDKSATPKIKAWPDVVRDLPSEFIAELDVYNLNMIKDEFPAVMCNNCGMQYPSLEDRKIKAPDECSGCQQKAKFG